MEKSAATDGFHEEAYLWIPSPESMGTFVWAMTPLSAHVLCLRFFFLGFFSLFGILPAIFREGPGDLTENVLETFAKKNHLQRVVYKKPLKHNLKNVCFKPVKHNLKNVCFRRICKICWSSLTSP